MCVRVCFLMRAFIKTCTFLQCSQNVSLHPVSEDSLLWTCIYIQVDKYLFCVSVLLVPELYSQFLGLLRAMADGQEELAMVES